MNTAEELNRLLHNSPVFADVNRLWNGTPDRLPIGTDLRSPRALVRQHRTRVQEGSAPTRF